MANIQIRSVDDALAAAAKAEAARRRMSLSDYLKDLLVKDLAAVAELSRRRALYDEIARTAPTHVTGQDTAKALAEARREMGMA